MMFASQMLLIWSSLAIPTLGRVLPQNDSACSSYSKVLKANFAAEAHAYPIACEAIISTRGTLEPQGPSVGFKAMNNIILKNKKGGKVYNVVYPAAFDQQSDVGTADIVRKVNELLSENPGECIILQGYSQGASATCDALPKLTGSAFDAIKGLVLLGNPEHQPDLACNVDGVGGKKTLKAKGFFSAAKQGIPSEWVSKSLDICNFGDGVCDTAHGLGITMQHFGYIFNQKTHTLGAKFIEKKLE